MNKDDLYGAKAIADSMQTQWIGQNIRFYEKVDSTNLRAKLEAEKGAESGTLIVAECQTAGRGRRGRVWNSPHGANLYFTLILKPKFAPDKASMLTLVMALAVVRGMEQAMEAEEVVAEPVSDASEKSAFPKIKWPNDIVWNDRKVCGILTEMSVQQGVQNRISHVLIGVGINVYQQEFPPELAKKATSLETECGRRISRSKLLADIMQAFEKYYDIFREAESLAGLKKLYNQKLVNCSREVRVLDPKGEFMGIATGINDVGELCVTLADGSTIEVYAGEVSVRGICGYV